MEAKYIYTKEFRLPSENYPDETYERIVHIVYVCTKILSSVALAVVLSVLVLGFAELQRIPNYLVMYEDNNSVESAYNSKFVDVRRIQGEEERYSVFLFNIEFKEFQVDRIKNDKVLPSGRAIYIAKDYKENGETVSMNAYGTLSFTTQDGKFAAIGHDMDIKISEDCINSLFFAKVDQINVNEYFDSIHVDITDYDKLGIVSKKTDSGIFGQLRRDIEGENIPVALRNEIKNGKAQLLTTIDGENTELYDVNVEIQETDKKLNGGRFFITVVDEDFYKIARMILKGMSGSPVIQDGKVIGVVATTFYTERGKGSCTFADEMLRDMQTIEVNK